ncbi:MAG: cytochrome c oxidase subunit 2A [Anaerolineales bacterium]|nr:cytochrome c oxidase subunit 2A [Anaerolineales bacterium]
MKLKYIRRMTKTILVFWLGVFRI